MAKISGEPEPTYCRHTHTVTHITTCEHRRKSTLAVKKTQFSHKDNRKIKKTLKLKIYLYVFLFFNNFKNTKIYILTVRW